VNRRIHKKRRILDSDKKYSGILFLFWMECPYFASKMEKENKKIGEISCFLIAAQNEGRSDSL